MAFARVVTFEGVDKDHMQGMRKQMTEGDKPEGLPATEVIVLYDEEAEKSVAIVFFDTEEDYRKGDEFLSAMPAGDTPGKRSSVTKYEVAVRMSS
jgi:hypothetical protein